MRCAFYWCRRGLTSIWNVPWTNAAQLTRSGPCKNSVWNPLCLLTDSCWFIVWLTPQSRRLRRHVPPKRRLPLTRQRDVVSQKCSKPSLWETSNPVQTFHVWISFSYMLWSIGLYLFSRQTDETKRNKELWMSVVYQLHSTYLSHTPIRLVILRMLMFVRVVVMNQQQHEVLLC